jgi:hypothetical protein
MITVFTKPTISFHGGQKYLEVHPYKFPLPKPFFKIKDILNVSDTNMTAVKCYKVGS